MTEGRPAKLGRVAIWMSWAVAAPTRSRSLPSFEVATRTCFMCGHSRVRVHVRVLNLFDVVQLLERKIQLPQGKQQRGGDQQEADIYHPHREVQRDAVARHAKQPKGPAGN